MKITLKSIEPDESKKAVSEEYTLTLLRQTKENCLSVQLREELSATSGTRTQRIRTKAELR